MDYFEINGSKTLNGVVEVSGAKNAVLPLMAAAILNKEKLKISNVPSLSDSITMSKLLEEMGADYVIDDCIVVNSNTNNLNCSDSILPQTWCLQTASEDGDGCSIWSVHSTDTANLGRPLEALEWVGSLDDLAVSQTIIP